MLSSIVWVRYEAGKQEGGVAMSFSRVIVMGSLWGLIALFWGTLSLAGGTTSTTMTSGTTTTSTTATTGTHTTGTTSTTGTGETGDTGNEEGTGDTNDDTGDTGDTGDTATVVDTVDTGLNLDTAMTYPASASSIAGEQGGCACQTSPSIFSLTLPLSTLFMTVAWTRRRRIS